MINIMELRQRAKKKVDEARALNELPKKESRAMNEEELKHYNELIAEVDGINAEIQREERLQALEMGSPAPRDPGPNEFREFGDFLQAIRYNPGDAALKKRDVPRSSEKRVLTMGVGGGGGFLVPEQFSAIIRQIDPQAVVIRPRALVIPAGDPPDAAITMPALNQSGALGVYSGVVVTWIAEGGLKPETEPSFQEIKLEPQEVAAHTVVTDKLLRNSGAAGPLVSALLRKAINASEDQAFLTGGGVGMPAGIIGHPATIPVARTGAGAIIYADLVNVYARALFGGPMAWIASPTTLPQLMTMVTPLGQLVWQPNAREGAPGTIFGFPVIINQRNPVLGAQGDLMLVDLNYYLIKDGSGIGIAASEHPLFTHNQTIIKAFWNVDGQPWLTTPLLLEDGVTTSSPFVVLL
jgi:HK97 family phage major capsid protein